MFKIIPFIQGMDEHGISTLIVKYIIFPREIHGPSYPEPVKVSTYAKFILLFMVS